MKFSLRCLIIAFLGYSSSSNAAPPSYSVTDLGLGQSVAGINNGGTVIGSDGSGKGIVYGPGGLNRDLSRMPTLPSVCGFIYASNFPVSIGMSGINVHGTVVFGALPFADSGPTCVMTYASNTLQFQLNVDDGNATGINAAGQIVGISDSNLVGFGPGCDFVRGGNFITALGINDSAQIIGNGNSGAEICTNGVWQIIPLFNTATSLFARALNNVGNVVGDAYTASATHAFIYSNGKARDVGVLPGATYASAESINVHSQVVGQTEVPSGSTTFLYTGGVLYDLATLISPTDHYKSYITSLSGSARINDPGVIATTGIDIGGSSHIYLLTPIK